MRMLLNFTKQYHQKDTEFTEKIIAPYVDSPKIYVPKIHTIRNTRKREGPAWVAGMKIHMVTGARTKQYNQFNKDIPELQTCTGNQIIAMSYDGETLEIMIAGKRLSPLETEVLIKNDGFTGTLCEKQFYRWFFPPGIQEYCGTLIHWTDYRY